jgi:glycosyltransferase involved in cell wall biosynthesis
MVITLSNDEALRKKMGANAKELAEKKYNKKIIYSQYANYLEELMRLPKALG